MEVVLNIADFRTEYPKFSDEIKYPDVIINSNFDTATIFIANHTNCILDIKKLTKVLYLLTAHLLQLETDDNAGNPAGVITSASIDKISVTIAEPKNKTEFSYFLNRTTYGQQLAALFRILSMGGIIVNGSPEILAYNRVNR